MTDIGHQRLHHQAIAPANRGAPGEVVRHLGAVQAQDYTSALWALGLRSNAMTEAAVEQAVRDKQLVRTWPMRGTLHFVAPEDIRWMLALLTPRVIARAARRRETLELDDATLARAASLFAAALEGGLVLTRGEMLAVLEGGSISPKGQRGYHLLWWAAQTGLLCFGPRQGKQDTFVLLDEWLPEGRRLDRDEALSELAQRYFTSHGPATLHDFMWWSGLPAAEARAGAAMAEAALAQRTQDGRTYWFAATASGPGTVSPRAHLLPAFDEYLLGYKDRRDVLDPDFAGKIVPGRNGVFKPILVLDGRVVGIWKRTLRKSKVVLTLHPFSRLTSFEEEAVAVAAEPYGRFLGLPVDLNLRLMP